jgi:ubiquinone/menaquinone biosynthesis C-methylase UbiE
MTATIHSTDVPASGAALLDAAGLRSGARVLDVGCARGDTTLLAARRVGPSGLVLGVDTSLTMLENARSRAVAAGLRNVGFLHGDAQTQQFAALRFDVIVSSRGLDVFSDADAGVTNLTGALRAGGRVVLAVRDDPTRARAALDRAGLVDAVVADTGAVTAARRVSSPGASGSRCPPTGAAGARAPGPRSGGPARG